MPLTTRVLARLDLKPSLGVVKGVRFEGLRVVGDPATLAMRYADQGADEMLCLDLTASLYSRALDLGLVRRIAETIYVPLTVGGGVRSLDDIRRVLRAGADKVAINTAAIARPDLIDEAARAFGSQAIVVSVEAKRTRHAWAAYVDAGRQLTWWEVVTWCHEACARGAGEILLTSVDRDGTAEGYDLDLIETVSRNLEVPLVASGGFGRPGDAVAALHRGADAVAVSTWLHGGGRIDEIKQALTEAGAEVRG